MALVLGCCPVTSKLDTDRTTMDNGSANIDLVILMVERIGLGDIQLFPGLTLMSCRRVMAGRLWLMLWGCCLSAEVICSTCSCACK